MIAQGENMALIKAFVLLNIKLLLQVLFFQHFCLWLQTKNLIYFGNFIIRLSTIPGKLFYSIFWAVLS